jgi:hypothetical protein
MPYAPEGATGIWTNETVFKNIESFNRSHCSRHCGEVQTRDKERFFFSIRKDYMVMDHGDTGYEDVYQIHMGQDKV